MTPITLHRGADGGPGVPPACPSPHFTENFRKTSAQGNRADLRLLVNTVSLSYGCIRDEVGALVKLGGLGTARANSTEIGKKLVWV